MNALIFINGEDVTGQCLLSATRLATDSTRRITTGEVTVIGSSPGRVARYDYARYDEDTYGVDVRANYPITILDGRDAATKLFEGRITTVDLVQLDGVAPQIFYHCAINDYAAILDRSVCWGGITVPMPISDHDLIVALIGHFAPEIHLGDIATLLPVIQKFDWLGKTCRQVLDDLATLSTADWFVDFDAVLHYRKPDAAPLAPFALSTSHDDVTSFPVRVDNYHEDFSNPVNHAFVRGAPDPVTGIPIQVEYADPISVGKYGEQQYSLVDTQITNSWDASLRAQSLVLKYANPIEAGTFTIWKDGLQSGQRVQLVEDALGINGEYVIRALTMQWEDQDTVRYEVQFGASQPDLETILRVLAQRAVWSTSMTQVGPSVPAPGSVSDASIIAGGLSAAVINSVNATTIQGLINAGQIGSVNAGTIQGQITSGQIGTVNAGSIVGQITSGQINSVSATTIQGTITAGQIGSVNAATINGVILGSQLADQIIDNLSKYAAALVPIQMIKVGDPWPPAMPNKNFPPNSFFYYEPDGHFYQVTADGMLWTRNDNPRNTLMSFYYIGAISATSITGVILAAQIQSITAGQITGLIQASQISSVNASAIAGTISAGQISTVNASSIQGTISAGQISSVNATSITGTISAAQIGTITAGQITGTLAYTQIGSVNAATITIGLIGDNQIGSISGAKLNIGSVDSDKFNGFSINVGGAGNKPGRMNVYDASGVIIAQVGTLDSGQYGGWFKVFGAGGSGWNNAMVRTDTSGNLFVNNANFTISAGGYQITMSPTTFDSSYGSLAIQVTGGSDHAALVSRGVVVYNNTSVIGAFVRDPGNASNVQIALYNSASQLGILIDGWTATVRAGEFQVGGNPGITENVVVGGVTLRFAGGIYIGH